MVRRVTAHGRSGRTVTSDASRTETVVSVSGGGSGRVVHGHARRVSVAGIGAATFAIFMAAHAASSPPLGEAVTGTASAGLSMGAAGLGTFTQAYTGTGAATFALSADALGAFTPPITGTGAVTLDLTASALGEGGALTGTADAALILTADGAGSHYVTTIGAGAAVLSLAAAGAGQALAPIAGVGASVLALLASGAGTAGSGTATGIAVVGPHANYNGAAGSGSVAPAGAATRALNGTANSPMAVGRIMTCPGQRVSGQLLLKIPCDAYGGIAQVNLSGDCAATSIGAMSLVDFVDVNSVPRKEFYHAVYLDAPAFVAKGGTAGSRQATIYVEIVPTLWPTVQKRVLAFHFYPEATDTDGTYNVGAGQTYTTIKAALEAAKTDARKAPLIQIKASGFYEMEDSTWGTYAGGRGFAVIAADPGVTATIRRAADFHPTNSAAWKWTPGWDGIEFRGAGIVIDARNTTGINTTSKPCFGNGARLTNSIGTRDTNYWNHGPHPGWTTNFPSWWQYMQTDWVNGTFYGQLACIGLTNNGPLGDIYSHTPLVYGCHDEHANLTFYTASLKAMTVTYVGPGSATIAKTSPAGAGTLVLTDGNVGSPRTITLGSITADKTVTQVVAEINALSGWTAVAFDTTRGARYFTGDGSYPGDVNAFAPVAVGTAPVQLNTHEDFHADGTQTYGGEENFIYWNWTMDTDIDMSQILRMDGRTDGGSLGDRDISFVNCVLLYDINSGSFGPYGTGAHHIRMEHCTTNLWIAFDSGAQEVYNRVESSIVGAQGTGGDPTAGPAVQFHNNLHTFPNGAQAFTGPTITGNTSFGNAAQTDARDLLSGPTTHDFSPKGAALANLKPSVFPYDQRGVARSASDAAGAWSKNAA